MSAKKPKSYSFIEQWNATNEYLTCNLLFRFLPKNIPQYAVINLQKGSVLPTCLLLLFFVNNGPDYDYRFRLVQYLYTGLHGGYSILWILKHFLFGDPNWNRMITLPSAFVMWACCLGHYHAMAIMALVGYGRTEIGFPTMLIAMLMYILGLFFMIGSDCQKYFVLKAKKGLITDGFFSVIRHPNYFGEMLIYFSFALVLNHWYGYVVIFTVWIMVFSVNISMKEISMSRYPEWKRYTQNTKLIIPYLF